MVKIRLARHGRKKKPFYQIVVADQRFSRNGRFIEKIGYYNGLRDNFNECKLDIERIEYWIGVGAVPTPQVASIYKNMKNRPATNTQVDAESK